MIKKSYHITGFDCAHCALKSEKHLNKHPAINNAVIDFAKDKLFIEYKDKELTIDEILKSIAEVESDPIEIVDATKEKKRYKIFNKDFWYTLARVLIGVTIILVCSIALTHEQFYIQLGLYAFGIVLLTYDVTWKVILHIVHKENPIDESLLITLCTVGAFIVAIIAHEPHFFMEALMVVTLYQVGKIIEGIATNKSKEAVARAVNLRIEHAAKLVNGEIQEVSPEMLDVNDMIVVTAGEYIPVDAVVISGDGQVDTSSLTGEFVPVSAKEGMELYSGYLLKEGTLNLKVIRTYQNSAVSKIIDLISNSGAKKSKADEFVSRFAKWYTPIVFIASLLVAIIGGAVTNNWKDWVILGLKMMVVACPCAIVISVPLAYFAALGLASKNGIVFKGTNYIDELNRMEKLVTDKTGTLTKGVFEISKIVPIGVEQDFLLDVMSSVESLSNHPIGKTIAKLKKSSVLSENFEELAGLGVCAEYKGDMVLIGNSKLLNEYEIEFEEVDENGVAVYCVYDGKYIGYLVISDEVRESSKELVSSLQNSGVDVVLLTGDKEHNTQKLCSELGIKKYYSSLLPDQKIECLEKELSNKYATGFIGDGINDAASIKRADIGFAMGAIGSDAAIESADVVIMNDEPMKVYDSIRIAKIARHTSIFNIIFALSVKIGVELAAIITSLLGKGELIPMWLAVLADTGLTVLMVINSLLILYRKIKRKSV
jgi:Cd2+/Zn2+-exporting ATPase